MDKLFNWYGQVAINWCICKGTIPIPGVKSVKQAEENLGALGWKLRPNELDELEYAARESPAKMIQNVFQTRYDLPRNILLQQEMIMIMRLVNNKYYLVCVLLICR